jgi:hypothetical protein
MDIKKFTILEWIKRDLLIMKRIDTTLNCADVMTKQTGKNLFYRHFDYILGHVIPTYVKAEKNEIQVSTLMDQDYIRKMTDTQMIHYILPPVLKF